MKITLFSAASLLLATIALALSIWCVLADEAPLSGVASSPNMLIMGPPQPQDLTFVNGPSGETIFTVHPDGKVDVNPKYTNDEAARVFWDGIKAWGFKCHE